MGLETATYISDLVATNPTASDAKSQGDDHIRLLKSTVKATFPNVTGAVTATHTELNTVTAKAAKAGDTYTGTHDLSGATSVLVPTPTLSGQAATKGYADALSIASGNVPVGGSAGQVLAKNSATNYDTVWVDKGLPYLKVSDQKASGTAGGTSLAADITQVRTLNTVETNTISGASLASNTITLPAGTYSYRVSAPHYNGSSHKAFLYNSTDASYTGIGTSEYCASGGATASTSSIVTGQFTIAASKDFKVRHFTTTAFASGGLGPAVSSGQVEVFTVAEFWKVA